MARHELHVEDLIAAGCFPASDAVAAQGTLRYRNAEGQGWDGQGAMPDWLHRAVKAGQRLDHFMVSDATRP